MHEFCYFSFMKVRLEVQTITDTRLESTLIVLAIFTVSALLAAAASILLCSKKNSFAERQADLEARVAQQKRLHSDARATVFVAKLWRKNGSKNDRVSCDDNDRRVTPLAGDNDSVTPLADLDGSESEAVKRGPHRADNMMELTELTQGLGTLDSVDRAGLGICSFALHSFAQNRCP